MKTSELHGKLLDTMLKARNQQVLDGLNSVSPGIDVAYEFGRRVGGRTGMDFMISVARDFFAGQERQDEKL